MKALVLKDFYVLRRQMWVFAIVLIGLAAAGGTFNHVFVVVWCGMLPYTAMAYDERSHWDQMAAMMPYSRRDLVLSKYVLGWLFMAAAFAVMLLIQLVKCVAFQDALELGSLAVGGMVGIISMDITLPLIFRFGVERGRLTFMIVIVMTAFMGSGALVAVNVEGLTLTPVVLILAAAAATAVSIPISMKLYKAN